MADDVEIFRFRAALGGAAMSMTPGSIFAHIYDGDDFVEVVWICPCQAYQLHVADDDTMIAQGFANDVEVHDAAERALEDHAGECDVLLRAHEGIS